ncbi:MAG: SCO family protein [Leptospiraceae bacterium]|nr:SCO family protein [Leptospiraceae bacterium]
MKLTLKPKYFITAIITHIIIISFLIFIDFKRGFYGFISSPKINDFQMFDLKGNLFNRKNLQKKYYFITFGYLQCPDICPMQMKKISKIAEIINDPEIGFIYVTIDPKRDKAEKLSSYLSGRDSRIIGLRNDNPGELENFSNNFKVQYSKEIFPNNEKTYKIHHSNFIVLTHKTLNKIIIYPDGLEEYSKIKSDLALFKKL